MQRSDTPWLSLTGVSSLSRIAGIDGRSDPFVPRKLHRLSRQPFILFHSVAWSSFFWQTRFCSNLDNCCHSYVCMYVCTLYVSTLLSTPQACPLCRCMTTHHLASRHLSCSCPHHSLRATSVPEIVRPPCRSLQSRVAQESLPNCFSLQGRVAQESLPNFRRSKETTTQNISRRQLRCISQRILMFHLPKGNETPNDVASLLDESCFSHGHVYIVALPLYSVKSLHPVVHGGVAGLSFSLFAVLPLLASNP